MRPPAEFNIGQQVRVCDGPFTCFGGALEEIEDPTRLKVVVSIFGRPKRIELEFD
jgi:transcriptional antiterminator NusG